MNQTPLELTANPLLTENGPPTADTEHLEAPTIMARPNLRHARRQIRDARRIATAAEALAAFDHRTTIYGFTKGQFSIIDILRHLLETTGPADLVMSTWTAAQTDLTTVLEFVDSGRILSARWLVDLTFQRRSPELAHRIRQTFGQDAIRVAKNHAKFALLSNAAGPPLGWRVCLQSSMNLNFNPRFENFTASHDPELFDFHAKIIEELWRTQSRAIADANPHAIEKFFDAHM